MVQDGYDFNAVRIGLASPEQIRMWSYGEVTKPETINYRTLRPEKDGLFCERIFGPTKDWECYCGKYKKIRYKGVICDRCGVEVARAKVRRERMGHIQLAAPVAHIWFSKGIPSRLGLLLDLSPRNLERVLYFAQYLVTFVDQDLRNSSVEELQEELERILEKLEEETRAKIAELGGDFEDEEKDKDLTLTDRRKIAAVRSTYEENSVGFKKEVEDEISALESLRVGQLLTENRYRELNERHGDVFAAGMGAEAVIDILKSKDLDKVRDELQELIRTTTGQRRKKAIKTLRVVEAFRKSGNKPEWMVLTILPVLPPELRPMVQLDGGRFATSDLNDLYRRVINRNNRLKRLIELQAPEIIVRNEKRMLQEAVDALIDNGRRGRAVAGSHNHTLKSLSDLLRGKQGRFRQNLLGKRVDYSGRSVIIVGPDLKLHECGLPRRMALELFKPFVMNRLVIKGYAHNIKSAKRMAERVRPEVWDILEEVIRDRPVLLNRAPTLHRLGIQAFQPVLIEGSAIQVHPLVCSAFNADFDGDQMAVHVPLSREAVLEAKRLMLSVYNMLLPSSGEPSVTPTLDMALGCYYLTIIDPAPEGEPRVFASHEDARLAHELGQVGLRAAIRVRNPAAANGKSANGDAGEFVETSVGRIIFNDVLPPDLGFRNEEIEKNVLKEITGECFRMFGHDRTAEILDAIKELGFHYASKAGITIAINDIEVAKEKKAILADAESKVNQFQEQYQDGLITEDERYRASVDAWTAANDSLTQTIQDNLRNYGGIYLMATSGAKGNVAQIKQMAGMRGLMSNPKGRIIDRPIKSSFREGLSVLEYFLSTHGARKGLADTALRTADSGYLTRRLIDVSQEITVVADDCGAPNGLWIPVDREESLLSSFDQRVKTRYLAAAVIDQETGEIIAESGEAVSEETIRKIREAEVAGVSVRSPLTCEARRGVCCMCYGISLATLEPVIHGEAVGIIAAQSIGEPGTQLTMRTFHTGGIAGTDITSGLPRVEELFEARSPKGEAVLTEIDGSVEITESAEGRTITVMSQEEYSDTYELPPGCRWEVEDGAEVVIGTKLAEPEEAGEDSTELQPAADVVARVSGMAQVDGNSMTITWSDEEHREYTIPAAAQIIVSGDKDSEDNYVRAGDALTAGPKNPQQILQIQGREAVQNYLIEEVQKVYRSQGVTIHDKHIEVIIAQMLRKVRIDSPGDTNLLPGELVDRQQYEDINAEILAEGGEPATASPVLLGVTRASLSMESFLAAASFQETTRVLTESAVNGDTDYLRGLKENVIIGRLIPARFDLTEEGRKRLGIDELMAMEQPKPIGDFVRDAMGAFEPSETMEELPAL